MVSFRKASKQKESLKYFSIPRFDNLTELIGGLRENELITISARVGCGKTTLALNLFTELARENKCWYISYEMNTKELIDKIYQFCDNPNQDNMYFDDNCDFNIYEMKKLIADYGFKFIFIDYLQIMSGNIKKNTRELKQLCRECNVVVFMLAQLNRKGENVEPQLSMLKDSGTIEQDSDEVWFIKQSSIKVAKNRKGQVGEIDTCFEKDNSYFYENDEFSEKKQELKNQFLKLCDEYLHCKEKKKAIMWCISKINWFLDTYVKSFDTTLYKGFKDILLKVIEQKTKMICSGYGESVWVLNLKLF